jgi:hypothetical protein
MLHQQHATVLPNNILTGDVTLLWSLMTTHRIFETTVCILVSANGTVKSIPGSVIGE